MRWCYKTKVLSSNKYIININVTGTKWKVRDASVFIVWYKIKSYISRLNNTNLQDSNISQGEKETKMAKISGIVKGHWQTEF